jgi:phosphoglycolate phosphatase
VAEFAPRRFRFVVFDWDGTLADSTAVIVAALRNACADVGAPVPPERDARYVIGLGLEDTLDHIAPTLAAEGRARLLERYRYHYLSRDGQIVLFDGVRELLYELDCAGFLLGIATGKSKAGLADVLARQDLARHFVATRCADEGFPKPHPDMLLALMDRVGALPEETLMIGDTTHDLALARNAGVAALAVAYGAHSRAGLEGEDALATLHSVPELRGWLRENA